MRSLQKVVWSEGLLLQPQHLQALDRFHEAHVGARVEAIAPGSWGVLEMELDPAALAGGRVSLLRFSGILPCGLHVAFEEPASGPPPRDVPVAMLPAVGSLEVHLAVPREREGVASYADEGAPGPSRYLAADRMLADCGAPDSAASVRLARPNPVLLLGDEPRENHDAIQIAELQRTSTGQLAPVAWYVPPALRVAVSPALISGLREVLARAIAKARELAEAAGQRSGAEPNGPDLVRLLQLLVLDAHVPVLAHLAESGDATPRACYLELARFAGQLAAFGAEPALAAPPLAPLDLRSTFQPLLAALLERLGQLAARRHCTVPLERRPGGLLLARLEDDGVLAGQLFLSVESDQPEAVVLERLPRLAKLAPASQIEGLVKAAAPGLSLELVRRLPPQLPARAGTILFALTQDHPSWRAVAAERNLAIYLPPPFDPDRTRLELLAIPAEAAADRRGPP